jgi:RNA recognition motif-containing protein
MDDTSGLSKGFGFVEMTTQDETDKAIKALNAKVIDGKKFASNGQIKRRSRPVQKILLLQHLEIYLKMCGEMLLAPMTSMKASHNNS